MSENNHNNDTRKTIIVNAQKAEQNASIGHVQIEIGELQVKGVTLKNLKASAHADITDENVRVQCDATLKFFNSLLGEFGGSLRELLSAAVETQKARTEFYKTQSENLKHHNNECCGAKKKR